MLLGLGLGLIPVFSRLASVRVGLLFPVVFLFAVIGTYAYHQSLFDVGLAFAFAGIVYLMIKLELPRATFPVGFILAPLLEANFRPAMQTSAAPSGLFPAEALANILWAVALVSVRVITGHNHPAPPPRLSSDRRRE